MSSDDVLARATRALRTESTLERPAASGRGRLLATLHARRVRARRITVSTLVFATMLVTSVAWAAATGRLPLPHRFSVWIGAHSSEPAPARAARVIHPPASATTASHVAEVQSAPATPPALAERIPSPPIEAPTVIEPPRAAAPAQTVVAPPERRHTEPPVLAAPSPDDPLDALYISAHRSHFVDRNAGAALAAWDRYLAAAPDGRFAPEARYNRALSLARLGRYDEARAALAPFARGDFGEYRRREANELSNGLPRTP